MISFCSHLVLAQSEERNSVMSKHVRNRFSSTVGQWFLRASSRAGFRGLPLQIYFLLALGFVFSLGGLLLYALTNIVGAFYDPAYGAMVADLVQPERREEVYGLGYMTGNMGTMVGPLIGGGLASVNGYSVLFRYAAIFAAATREVLR